MLPEQLPLVELDLTILRGHRLRRERGWTLHWAGPLGMVPDTLPPAPGSELLHRAARGPGGARWHEWWIRPRPRHGRPAAGGKIRIIVAVES
jgi:hypothetical protein